MLYIMYKLDLVPLGSKKNWVGFLFFFLIEMDFKIR